MKQPQSVSPVLIKKHLPHEGTVDPPTREQLAEATARARARVMNSEASSSLVEALSRGNAQRSSSDPSTSSSTKYEDPVFSRHLLRETLVELGFHHLTMEDVNDVFSQIAATKTTPHTPNVGHAFPTEALVLLSDVAEWMEAIMALDAAVAPSLPPLSSQSTASIATTAAAKTRATAESEKRSPLLSEHLSPIVGLQGAVPGTTLELPIFSSVGEDPITITGTASSGFSSRRSSANSREGPNAKPPRVLPTLSVQVQDTNPMGATSSARQQDPKSLSPQQQKQQQLNPIAGSASKPKLDATAMYDEAQVKKMLAQSPLVPSPNFNSCHSLLRDFVVRSVDTPELSLLDSTDTPEAVVSGIDRRGFAAMLRNIVIQAVKDSTSDPLEVLRHLIGDKGASTTAMSPSKSQRRTLAFASALSLRHVASGAGASLGLQCTLLFVDISGYSAVTSAIEHQGAHAVSAIVNGYLQKIVRVICEHGGDVVKFAGDALLALWSGSNDVENTLAAVRCATMLQKHCKREPIAGTTLEFGLHCGLSRGYCSSRIFAPRKLRNNSMPSHFHFLSGDPLLEVGEACGLGKRGENVVHKSVLDLLPRDAVTAVQVLDEASQPAGSPTTSVVRHSMDAHYFILTSVNCEDWPKQAPPVKASEIAAGAIPLVGGHHELLFVPPKVALVLQSGMDQFFMAELRELVVLFIHFAETTEVEVWFDEVFHILESFGCDVVQIIDDDKGIHIVAALNLYLMAEQSVDSSIQIALSMRAKRCDAHVGVAAGTVFCGVLGSAEACQWDISGSACVRAARLMQHAVANNLSACFDTSIFEAAQDRSSLKTLGSIDVKGSPKPVDVYTLRESRSLQERASLFQLVERVPMLTFHQSLCPRVHEKTIVEIRKVLRLRSADAEASSFRRVGSYGAFDERGSPSSHSGGSTPKREDSVVSRSRVLGQSLTLAKLVVLVGCTGTGKFCAAVNVLSESNTIPVVHECFERQVLVQLTLVHTIALWFSFAREDEVREAATQTLIAFRDHRQNEAFAFALTLLEAVCHSSPRKFAIVIRAGQFLDQSSVSFISAAAKKFELCEKIVFLVTCSPLFGYPEPEKKFVAFGNVKVFKLDTIPESEVQHLFTHCIKQKADDRLLSFVCRKSNNYVECIVELATFLQRRAMLTLSADGYARMRPSAVDEVEQMLWGEISRTIRAKAVHILDHLSPELLTMCKIIASITEQPLITAFFYSVSKVCEVLQNAKLNVNDVKTLDALWLLKMCEHKCTAHTGTGELDAAVFLQPSMRDIVQSLLVPQQRVAINKICGDCYHETHPMNHPMQYLVRARHYLFAGLLQEYTRDLQLGWGLIMRDGAKLKDTPIIKTRYFDWMRDVDPNDYVVVLHNDEQLLKDFNQFCKQKRITGAAMSQRAPSTRQSNAGGAAFQIMTLLQRLSEFHFPMELAPARPAFQGVIKVVQLVVEMVDNGMTTNNATVLFEENSATMDSVLDQISAAVSGYVMSVSYCLDGTSRGVQDSIQDAFKDLKSFVILEVDCDDTRAVLNDTAVETSSTRVQRAEGMALELLQIIDRHLQQNIMPLCTKLRSESDILIDQATRMSVAIRRRVHFAAPCAVAEAARVVKEDRQASADNGRLIVTLFENLPTILDVYCPGSARLQKSFCEGLQEFYIGTLQPPETYELLRDQMCVFLFSWLNCCTQQLLFH